MFEIQRNVSNEVRGCSTFVLSSGVIILNRTLFNGAAAVLPGSAGLFIDEHY